MQVSDCVSADSLNHAQRRGEVCGVRRQCHTLCGLGKNAVRWGERCLLTLKEKKWQRKSIKKIYIKNEALCVGSFLQMIFSAENSGGWHLFTCWLSCQMV